MIETVFALLLIWDHEIKESRHNAVNILRLQKDVDKILSVIEILKDKVRNNGEAQ